eukprot:jgi/Mesvir1/25037/Mv16976-RA.1
MTTTPGNANYASPLLLLLLLACLPHDILAAKPSPPKPCAALFEGPRCEIPSRHIPPCLQGVFGDSSSPLTLVRRGSQPPERLRGQAAQLRKLPAREQGLADYLPPMDVFGGRTAGDPIPTCAAVASSARLRNASHPLGTVIDQAALVLRFNRAPTKQFERYVGTKTSVRFTNQLYIGWREAPGEAVVSKCRVAARDISRAVVTKAHVLDPMFVAYAASGADFLAKGQTPTSGFLAALLLLHRCARVQLFGYQPSGSLFKNWYYPHTKSRAQWRVMRKSAILDTAPVMPSSWMYAVPPSQATLPVGSGSSVLEGNAADTVGQRREPPATRQRPPLRPTAGSRALLWHPNNPKDGETRMYGEQSVDLSAHEPAGHLTRRGRALLQHVISTERKCLAQLAEAGMVTFM